MSSVCLVPGGGAPPGLPPSRLHICKHSQQADQCWKAVTCFRWKRACFLSKSWGLFIHELQGVHNQFGWRICAFLCAFYVHFLCAFDYVLLKCAFFMCIWYVHFLPTSEQHMNKNWKNKNLNKIWTTSEQKTHANHSNTSRSAPNVVQILFRCCSDVVQMFVQIGLRWWLFTSCSNMR